MLTYSALKAGVKAALLGIAENTAPSARTVEKTLMRPEGPRHYLLAQSAQSAQSARPAQGKRPLVLVLHGAGASARQVMGMAFPPSPLSVWLEIVERDDIVVAALDAGAGGWNDCFASKEKVARKDDVAFIDAVIDQAIAEHDIDAERIYLIGVSRGGLMAYRAAVEIPHKLAAFSAVMAGMPPPGRAVAPTVALPALIFGCTADPLMPYHGGKYLYMLGFLDPISSIEDSVKTWRELAGLPYDPAVFEIPHRNPWDKTRATRRLWGAAPDQLQVGLIKIDHAGHAEPSRVKRYPYFLNKLVGRQNADFEVAEAAWEFFRGKRIPLQSMGEPS